MTREEAVEVYHGLINEKIKEAFEFFAPELAESEDERIRKWIIEKVQGYADSGIPCSDEIQMANKALAYLEKQKEQKPIKMEVYEIGKGTTICGQDYRCKKDYKDDTINCRYIKDVIYHCGRDGYLTDQNGVSWSCTPEWFNEYIYTNSEWADKEKNDFVSGQFIQCKLSFDEFREGEHYWLEYIGDDMYVGRSDNILNQKFHITPRQLYTLFSQQLEEVQGPPQEEKQVSLNYEPPFDENPSDDEIIEALIKHLKEQDGFLTAIDCVSTKSILRWLEKQKEQKPMNNPKWNELTWKDINELEEIINHVHYEFRNGISAEGFGKEVLEQFRNMKEDAEVDACEQKSAEWNEPQTDFRNINEAFENGKKEVISHPEKYDLCKSAEWSEEDEKIITRLIGYFESFRIAGVATKWEGLDIQEVITLLKSLRNRPKSSDNWKPSEEQMKALLSCTDRRVLAELYEDLQKRYGTC